jgi:hypothetical protein
LISSFIRLKNLFHQLHQDFVKNVKKHNKVKLVFEHDLFREHIWFPFMSPDELTPDVIMQKFDMIVQSYKLGSTLMQQKHNFTAKVMIGRKKSISQKVK